MIEGPRAGLLGYLKAEIDLVWYTRGMKAQKLADVLARADMQELYYQVHTGLGITVAEERLAA